MEEPLTPTAYRAAYITYRASIAASIAAAANLDAAETEVYFAALAHAAAHDALTAAEADLAAAEAADLDAYRDAYTDYDATTERETR